MTETKAAQAKRELAEDRADAKAEQKAEQKREDAAEAKAQAQAKPTPAAKPSIFAAKPTGPTKEQIEAAKQLRAAGPVVVAPTPESDPRPVEPVWSGKDADFPAWVAADMRFKEAHSEWMGRRKK